MLILKENNHFIQIKKEIGKLSKKNCRDENLILMREYKI